MSEINSTTKLPVTFYIADWYVDTNASRIRLGEIERKLETKVMAVLAYLAARPGGLVTREELEQAVWHDTVVGYDALTNCITKLRKALEDSSHQPRYIETVSKKGYRLIARVSNTTNNQTLPEESGARHQPKTMSLLGLLIVFAISGLLIWQYSKTDISDSIKNQTRQSTIAVLPFNNLSQDSSQDSFSDGITVDITTELSKISGLLVINSPSAMNYKAHPVDATKVANELGVRYVLSGNFRRAGNKLRINAQLIDGLTGIHLWAEKYDREMKEIFDVQDDITAKIVKALSIKLKKESSEK